VFVSGKMIANMTAAGIDPKQVEIPDQRRGVAVSAPNCVGCEI